MVAGDVLRLSAGPDFGVVKPLRLRARDNATVHKRIARVARGLVPRRLGARWRRIGGFARQHVSVSKADKL
jgi:hypothetical protein